MLVDIQLGVFESREEEAAEKKNTPEVQLVPAEEAPRELAEQRGVESEEVVGLVEPELYTRVEQGY